MMITVVDDVIQVLINVISFYSSCCCYLTMYDQYGQTPLYKAAYNGHTAVVTLLLDRGASIDLAGKVSHIVCMVCCRIDEGRRRWDGSVGKGRKG